MYKKRKLKYIGPHEWNITDKQPPSLFNLCAITIVASGVDYMELPPHASELLLNYLASAYCGLCDVRRFNARQCVICKATVCYHCYSIYSDELAYCLQCQYDRDEQSITHAEKKRLDWIKSKEKS